jgi:hypothetical protein
VWLEELLTEAGLPSPTQVSNYEDVARLHGLYGALGSQPAWTDYVARMRRVRADLTSDLLHGKLDKFGNSRDNEKRAALHVIDRLLAFPIVLNKQFDELHEKKLKQEERAKVKTGIHGNDVLSTTGESRHPGLVAR